MKPLEAVLEQNRVCAVFAKGCMRCICVEHFAARTERRRRRRAAAAIAGGGGGGGGGGVVEGAH